MKKYCTIISFMLAIAVIFASLSLTSVNAATQLGDPDGDGSICTAKDILCVRNYLAKNGKNADSVQILKADVCSNGVVDSNDLLVMRMYAAKKITTIPYEASTEATTGGYVQPTNPDDYPQVTAVLRQLRSVDEDLYVSVLVNQTGYSTNAKKVVKLAETMVAANSRKTDSFVANKTCRVYKIDNGQKTAVGDFSSGNRKNFNHALVDYGEMYVSELDISSIKTPGTYLVSSPIGSSFKFEIRDNSNERAMNEALMGLYFNRCGGDITAATLQEYDAYLAQNFGIEAGLFYNTYSCYTREACHRVSKGTNAGKEVAIVDTLKNVNSKIEFGFTNEPDTSGQNTILAQLRNEFSGITFSSVITNEKFVVTATYGSGYAFTENSELKSINNKIINIVNGYTSYGFKEPSATINRMFFLNKNSSGEVVYFPATDFEYGLHDAGDYGRYTQPAAQVVDDLLYAYELYPQTANLNVIHDEGLVDLPDVLDLARWEAKFLLNMQNKGRTGENPSSKGGFYYKICTELFASANGSRPENDKGFNGTSGAYPGLRVQQVNMASTASAVGSLAACYTVFKDKDPAFANECLAAAKAGYNYYVNHIDDGTPETSARNTAAANKSGDKVGGGAYGGTAAEASATFFFSAAALYRATGDETYNTKAKAMASGGNYTSMGGQNQGGFGNFAYYLAYAKDGLASADATTATKCLNNVIGSATKNNKEVKDCSLDVLDSSFAAWGSNGVMSTSLKTNAFAAAVSNYSGDTTDYVTADRLCIGFLMGKNPLGYCFLPGMQLGKASGDYKVTEHPHHYPSVLIQPSGHPCTPGILAEGYSTQSAAAGKNKATDSGRFRYRDEDADYVTNEIVVYGNSAFVFSIAAVVQQDMDLNK